MPEIGFTVINVINYTSVYPVSDKIQRQRKEITKWVNSQKGSDYSWTQVSQLKRLDLRRSEIRKIPDSIGLLTNLTELDLTGNKLRALPNATRNLTNLIRLSLSHNKLNTLPESIGNLINLTQLDLISNKFRTVTNSTPDLINYHVYVAMGQPTVPYEFNPINNPCGPLMAPNQLFPLEPESID